MFGYLITFLSWASDVCYWLLLYLILDHIGATPDMMLIFWVLLSIAVFFKILNIIISLKSSYE